MRRKALLLTALAVAAAAGIVGGLPPGAALADWWLSLDPSAVNVWMCTGPSCTIPPGVPTYGDNWSLSSGTDVRYLEGDLDKNCRIDAVDEQSEAFRYGVAYPHPLYDTWYDLEGSLPGHLDYDIDVKDVQFVFGRDGSRCDDPYPPDQGPSGPPVLAVAGNDIYGPGVGRLTLDANFNWNRVGFTFTPGSMLTANGRSASCPMTVINPNRARFDCTTSGGDPGGRGTGPLAVFSLAPAGPAWSQTRPTRDNQLTSAFWVSVSQIKDIYGQPLDSSADWYWSQPFAHDSWSPWPEETGWVQRCYQGDGCLLKWYSYYGWNRYATTWTSAHYWNVMEEQSGWAVYDMDNPAYDFEWVVTEMTHGYQYDSAYQDWPGDHPVESYWPNDGWTHVDAGDYINRTIWRPGGDLELHVGIDPSYGGCFDNCDQNYWHRIK